MCLTEAIDLMFSRVRIEPILRYLFMFCMMIAAIMPFVPDELSLLTVVFSLSFGLLVFLGMGKRALLSEQRIGTSGRGLILFYGTIFLSSLIGYSNGVNGEMWLRAVIPFTFLSIYFFIEPIKTEDDASFILNILHLAAVVWLAKIIIIAIAGIGQIFSGEIPRLTYLTMDLTLPYSLVGFTLSLFNPDPRSVRWRRPLSIAFLLIIILSGYRSQALIAAVVLLLYTCRQSFQKKLFLFSFLVVGVVTAFLFLRETLFLQEYILRFQGLAEEKSSSRMMEIEYALQHFLKSPVFGNGLGFPIPVEITFGGDSEFISRSVDVDFVGYIHNLWAYLLMDLGIVGFLSYSWFVGRSLWCGWHESPNNNFISQTKLSSTLVLLSLLFFFMAEPSFRHIQSNLMMGVLVALLEFKAI